MQCNLRTALLRTEPECSKQSKEDIQQQKSHTHHIVTDIIGPCLLEVAAYIVERANLRDKEVAYTELAFTVLLQFCNKIIILPFTDADTEFQTYIIERLFGQETIRRTSLVVVMIAYILQGCSQLIRLGRVTEKLETFAYKLRQLMVVLSIKIIRSQKFTAFQHLRQLFGRFPPCTLIAEDTHKVRSNHSTDSPFG